MNLRAYILSCIFLGVATMNFAGCAAVFNSTKNDVRINSSPPEAEVYINNVKRGKTPVILELETDENHIVEVAKPGYESKKIYVDRELEWGWLVADIFLFWPGLIIDGIGEYWYGLEKDYVTVDLTSGAPGSNIGQTQKITPSTLPPSPERGQPPPIALQERPNVAVLKVIVADERLKGSISPSDLDYVTGVIRDIAADIIRRRYIVMDANNMEAILKRHDKSLECVDDTQCAVDIGQTLEAEYIVISYMRKFGKEYKLTIRVYNTITTEPVSSARIGVAAEKYWQNNLEKNLEEKLRKVFKALP